MGYDITILRPPVDESDAIVWQSREVASESSGEAPGVFRTCHDLLVARFPEGDGGVWKDAPLWPSFGAASAHLSVLSSRADEAVPFIVETARSLGLFTLDWQSKAVHRPDGVKGFVLTLESRAALAEPSLRQMTGAVDLLAPGQGIGFFVLDGAGGDYVQIAGGDGDYTCEWRRYAGLAFTHGVAGYPDRPAEPDVRIATHGFHVTVKANEKLSAAGAREIVAAFGGGFDRPPSFSWRDITQLFGK